MTRQAEETPCSLADQLVRAWRGMAAALWIGGSMCLPAYGQALPEPGAKLVIGVDEDASTFAGLWTSLIYAEISRRLAIPVELMKLPTQRRSAMADDGLIDGENARVQAYGASHPNLVRVEESVLDLNFALYTAHPGLKVQRLEDLPAGKLLGEYRRGVLFCERLLASLLPAERLSDVTETSQGVKKLLAGRTDLYCDIDASVLSVQHDPTIKGTAAVRKLLDLGRVPTYPYLHQKHAALVARMAAALKAMKAEGLIEVYHLQAQRKLGWVH